MGYYYAVPCISGKKRDEMLAFLAENFRQPRDFITPWHDITDMPPPTHGKEVCAYAKRLELGFYTNAGWHDIEKHYAQCLLRWIAWKVGKRKVHDWVELDLSEAGEMPPGELPYLTGDNSPVVVINNTNYPHLDGFFEEGTYTTGNEVGWEASTRPLPAGLTEDTTTYIGRLRKQKREADPMIKAEMERLEELWKAAT